VPDIFVDGMIRVGYAAAIANIQAPTTTELNAGLLLTSLITADGLIGFTADTAKVDNSSLADTFDTVGIGRVSYNDTRLRLKKQSGTDTVYATFIRGTTGFIVIRRGILTGTAWLSTQAVEVYPIVCGERSWLAFEKNTTLRYEVPMPITSAPAASAAIA
jgi:hypothetical protein